VTELLALHGLNNSPQVWDDVAAHVAARRPGAVRWHAPALPALDTVEALAQALLAQAPPRFALAGFSFGGYVAMAMLEAAPQRIERLVLLASHPRADTDAQREVRRKAIGTVGAGGADAHRRLVALQAPLTMHPSRLEDAALRAARERQADDYGPQRLLAHLAACIARPDREAVLAAWRGPRRLVAAAGDQVVPAATMRAAAQAAPGCAFEAIDAAGHLVPLERPDAVGDALLRALDDPAPPG
jgi:pimeloyl-ACP methyl ester carboxylesterase